MTILPASAREIRVERGVKSRPIDDPAFVRQVSIVKKRNRTLPPAAQVFLEVCAAAMA
jgi:hypothetical protein